MEPDFSGYATKAGLKCSDGRIITPDAFKHQDQMTVPLVWSHMHSGPDNILGHAVLMARSDGMYTDAYFNDTDQGKMAKKLVQHGDITLLSIYANNLMEKVVQGTKNVLHGAIREVSLVLAGANPGAKIDFVALEHSDGSTTDLEDEAVIYTGLDIELAHREELEENLEHAEGDDDDDETIQDVYDSLSEKQKDAVHYMIGAAVEDTAGKSKVEHSATGGDNDENNGAASNDGDSSSNNNSTTGDADDNSEGDLTHQEGSTIMTNVFEKNGTQSGEAQGATLTHDQLQTIIEDTRNFGGSLKDSFLAHAQEYGITDIDLLFPDAKSLDSQPQLIARRTEWVAGVIDGAKHTPFSRIKSITADITAAEARARGYVKGNLKKEEIIKLLKRVTTPTTIYKKQKLDRDDMIDITDLDVVAWLKWEMRFMLEEELARAILVGDGREPDDEDKIDEDHIRPIAYDDDMYAHKVNLPTNVSPDALTESILRSRKNYRGTGTPTLYTTDDIVTDMLLIKDKMNRRLYNTEQELAAALRVKAIVVVEVLEDVTDLLAIMVNMTDYTIGADKGGQVSMFDDFDIDYNQYKYLIETRVSGALTKPKSALVITRSSGTTVTPQVPAFDEASNTITVPNQTGVSYYVDDVEVAPGALTITETTEVEARADAGYNFPHNTDTDWTYAYTA